MHLLLPLLVSAAVLGITAAEIVRGQVGSWPVGLGLLCASGCLMAGVVFSLWREPSEARPSSSFPSTRLAGLVASVRPWVLIAGFVLGWGEHLAAPDQPVAEACYGREVVVVGTIRSAPRPRDPAGLRFDADRLVCNGQAQPPRVALEVVLTEPPDVLPSMGDRVRFRARVGRLPARDAAYLYDLRRANARMGRAGRLITRSMVISTAGETSLSSSVGRWRLRRELRLIRTLGPDRAAIPLALATGSRGLLTPARREVFDIAGLSHLLAISGLHLATLAGASLLLLGWLRLRLLALAARWRKPMDLRLWVVAAHVAQWGLSCVPTAAFGAVCGWPLSAQRAFVMIVAFSVVRMVQRSGRPEPVVALAALMLFGLETTHALFDVGFQFSVAAVAAIAAVLWPLRFRREEHDPAPGRRLGAVFTSLRPPLLVTFATSIVCAPIAAWHFGRVPLLGAVLNIVAVPLVQFAVLPLSAAALLFSGSLPGDRCAHLAADIVDVLRTMAALTPISGAPVGVASLATLLAGALAAGWALARGGPKRALTVVVLATVAASLPNRNDELVALPVGQGDAILVRSGSTSVLIDGGGSHDPRWDPGSRIIRPALARHGVARLDLLVVTHEDIDHIGGLPAVVRSHRPRTIWWAAPRGQTEAGFALLTAARDVDATITDPPTSARLGELHLRTIAFPTAHPNPHRNNASTLVEVTFRTGTRALLTGDIEAPAERAHAHLLRPVHILKAPHHGSNTSSTPDFVRRTSPNLTIFTTGKDNRFRHPHPHVVRRYGALAGASTWNTATCGEVVVRVQQKWLFVEAPRACAP